jgi:hypothetical protein
MALNPTLIEAPAVVPLRGGLLSAAQVHPEWDTHYGFGISFQSFLCGTGGTVSAPCGAAVPGITYDAGKEFGGSDIGNGYPFAVYAGVECDLINGPYNDQAKARLEGSEEYLVSKAFYEITMLGEQPFEPVQVANALPATSAPGDLADLVGRLEQYAALVYAGAPVLHMNRRTAARAIAADVVIVDPLSGALSTVQGTAVANGAGYPDGVIFITGQVHLWRSPVETYDVNAVMQNTAMTLAERLYVASTECLLAYAGVAGPAPTAETYLT